MLTDYPKMYCPFIRQTYKVEGNWRDKGLRRPEVYLAINKINPGYEWVFDDEDTFAVEKLNGTNIKIKTENGRLVEIQNRMNIIDPLQIMSGRTYIIEGIFRSIGKGYVQEDGEQVGELVGPKVNNNPYELQFHEWYPFEKAIGALRYKSFHNYERNFDNWEKWLNKWLFSLFYMKRFPKEKSKIMAEGVVFYNLKRKEEGKIWRAKLRRDMFHPFYDGLEIFDYDKNVERGNEDQQEFD